MRNFFRAAQSPTIKIIGVIPQMDDKRYGKLVFLQNAGTIGGLAVAYYQCDCGNVIRVYKYLVEQHIAQSCSSCRREVARPFNYTKHYSGNQFYNIIRYQGVDKTLLDWSAQFHIRPEIVAHRLYKLRWSVKKALITPPIKNPTKNPTH